MARTNIHCTNGRKCILLTDQITWDHDSRMAEHKLQEQYNGGLPCIVHTCAAQKLALERRTETLDVFKKLLAHDAPEEMAKYRQLRNRWKEVDVYKRIKTLCPRPRALRGHIFGKRSKLKLSEIMPDYLSGHKSVCLNCVPDESFSPLLDAIISKKLMHSLPDTAKPLMALGSHLSQKYMRKMGVAGKTLPHPDIKDLPLGGLKDLSQYNPNDGVVKMSQKLSELYRLEALNWKKKSVMCNCAIPPVSFQVHGGAEDVIDYEKRPDSDRLGQKHPEYAKPQNHIVNTYLDGDNPRVNKILTETSKRLEECNINEYIGDVWNQLQPEHIYDKEKKEKYFSKNVFPPSLNPVHSNVFPIEEVARMREPAKLLNYIAKYPRRRLALRTYIQGLEPAASKSHLVVKTKTLMTPNFRPRLAIFKKRKTIETSYPGPHEPPILEKNKLSMYSLTNGTSLAKRESADEQRSYSTVAGPTASVGGNEKTDTSIMWKYGDKNQNATGLSNNLQRLSITKESEKTAEPENLFFRASSNHLWE